MTDSDLIAGAVYVAVLVALLVVGAMAGAVLAHIAVWAWSVT